jgi:SAM-dependent methyltransferase
MRDAANRRGRTRRAPRSLVRSLLSARSGISSGLAERFPRLHDLRLQVLTRERVFAAAYRRAAWASDESGSGTGSELRATAEIRNRLPGMLLRLGIARFLDAPCGDWNWMRRIDLPVEEYTGVDIVGSVVEANIRRYGTERVRFLVRDITADPLPEADLVLCRDCLVHLSFADISATLENVRSTGARFLMTNTYPEVRRNADQFTGAAWRRLNLQLPPFGFPPPLERFPDGGDVDPSVMGLWQLADLPRPQVR